MFPRETKARLGEFWALVMGCTPEALSRPGIHLAETPTPPDHLVIRVLGFNDSLHLRGPVSLEPVLARLTEGLSPRTLIEPEFWQSFLAGHLKEVLGPHVLHYASADMLLNVDAPAVRRLDARDDEARAKLEAAVGAQEWDDASLHSSDRADSLFGAFEGDELVALAGVQVCPDPLRNIAICTHPAWRHRGYARQAASVAARAACVDGSLAQWGTDPGNAASLNLGRALGFVGFASWLRLELG
jgi:RimJ/RimL family protein N-acetyltransferase